MKKLRFLARSLVLLSLFLAFGCMVYESPGPMPAPGPEVSIEVFYDALSPYGEWILVDSHGWVWIPGGIEIGWRPYTHGRWIFTDFGWTWYSDWSWGWAPFHYGRWFRHRNHGWVWIPGRHWAPAWVAWRANAGWFGWAPLPPGVRWRVGVGLDLGGVDLGVSIVSDHWVFVADHLLIDHNLRSHLRPVHRNRELLGITRDFTRYRNDGRWVAERGLAIDRVEGILGRVVPRHHIEDLQRPPTRQRNPSAGQTLRIYRPKVENKPPSRTPSSSKSKGKGKKGG